jgi:hypothetical protein
MEGRPLHASSTEFSESYFKPSEYHLEVRLTNVDKADAIFAKVESLEALSKHNLQLYLLPVLEAWRVPYDRILRGASSSSLTNSKLEELYGLLIEKLAEGDCARRVSFRMKKGEQFDALCNAWKSTAEETIVLV